MEGQVVEPEHLLQNAIQAVGQCESIDSMIILISGKIQGKDATIEFELGSAVNNIGLCEDKKIELLEKMKNRRQAK